MPKIYPERLDSLVTIAESQDGYLTTEQARNAGISLQALASLERSGHLEREQYGVYRLARWPSSKRPGLWRAFLWATRIDPRATFSHRTALELHGVSDINPSKIDITLPNHVRARSAKPPAVVTYRRNLAEDSIEERDNLRVTNLYQTLLDLAADGLGRDAVAEILDRGISLNISPEQHLQLRAVYDLSDETRRYLVQSLRTQPTHRRL